MIKIDGSLGEGGGQVLRSALTLSVLTGKDLRIERIRGRRSKPGLRPQHLKSVEAAAAICDAEVNGAVLDSDALTFAPGKIKPGNYEVDIGTAGSAALVLQTVFLPLSFAEETSSVTIRGGTHVPWSPCFDYLNLNWLPYMWKIGFDSTLRLRQVGFYPRGGGEIRAVVNPVKQVEPLKLENRGRLLQISGVSAVANLKRNIATRQRRQVIGRLGRRYPLNDIRIHELTAPSPGSFILLLAEYEYTHSCYFALGAKGKSADKVADEATEKFEAFDATDAVLDQYLADQILLPLALAGGKSRFSTPEVTQHLCTNAEVIQEFLETKIEIQGQIGEPGQIEILPLADPFNLA